MRRPRAFTCSGMHAEPLPPPPRKPLGYLLHEEGWTASSTVRSSSPCQCGSCGRDSPSRAVSTPPPSKPSSPVTFPESCVNTKSAVNLWAQRSTLAPTNVKHSMSLGISPTGSTSSSGSSAALDGLTSSRKSIVSGRAPTRRIVLFGDSGVSEKPRHAGSSDGICRAIPFEQRNNQFERKRGSDEARGIVMVQPPVPDEESSATGSALAGAPFSTGAAVAKAFACGAAGIGLSAATPGSAFVARGKHSFDTKVDTSGLFGSRGANSDGAVPATSAVRSSLGAPATSPTDDATGRIFSGGSRMAPNWTSGKVQQNSASSLSPTAEHWVESQPAAALLFDHRPNAITSAGLTLGILGGDVSAVLGTVVAMGSSSNPNEFTAGGLSAEEWKTPETVTGTFSLGSSVKDTNVGRQRRRLRMRVGG